MTWDDNGYRILSDGSTYGAYGFGATDGAGDVCISSRLSVWYIQQSLPDSEL
jgi:hypothetical protein